MSLLVIDRSKKFSEFFDKKNEERKIDFMVLHHVAANSANHAIEMFKESQVSSHFLIDEDGKIFELVDENDVAYHAGISHWRGVDGLNKTSIGIEFLNSSPFEKEFEALQMQAGVELCQYLISKYDIAPENIIGHSDIGYFKETGFLDRKQDPSHLFDWKFFAQNGVGIFPDVFFHPSENRKLFSHGDEGSAIYKIKQSLKSFGYKIVNFNDLYDAEMQALAKVFNRHFMNIDSDVWFFGSQMILDRLVSKRD